MQSINVSPEERARRLGNVAAILIELAQRDQMAANVGAPTPAEVKVSKADLR